MTGQKKYEKKIDEKSRRALHYKVGCSAKMLFDAADRSGQRESGFFEYAFFWSYHERKLRNP